MSIVKLLGLSLMTAAMITLVDCKGNKNGEEASQNDTLSLPTEEYNDQTSVADDAQDVDQAATKGDQVMLEDQNGNLSVAPTETVNANDVFYIVAGSFTLYSNAQKLNNKLKAKGFDSKILEPYGQYNRVTVKQFKTVAEARAALPELRKSFDQDLWLLTR
jgi:cell division protein FtsN